MLRDKLKENVARITGPLRSFSKPIRRRQWERHWFNEQNNGSGRAFWIFVHFFASNKLYISILAVRYIPFTSTEHKLVRSSKQHTFWELDYKCNGLELGSFQVRSFPKQKRSGGEQRLRVPVGTRYLQKHSVFGIILQESRTNSLKPSVLSNCLRAPVGKSVEHRAAMRKVVSNTQGVKITEEKVLPL